MAPRSVLVTGMSGLVHQDDPRDTDAAGRALRRQQDLGDYAVWCSQRDIVRMIELCIAAPPTLRFDVFYAVSDNRWGYRDLEHARAVLGFEPRDRAEDHR